MQANLWFKRSSTVLMPIRRLAGTAGISVPVTACAIQTAIFLRKSKQHDKAITVRVMAILAMAAADIAVAGIQYPAAATELISISGMGVVIPPAWCHANFKTALSTSTVALGAATIDHSSTTRKYAVGAVRRPAPLGGADKADSQCRSSRTTGAGIMARALLFIPHRNFSDRG